MKVWSDQNLLRAAFGGVTVQQNLGEHPQEGDGEEGRTAIKLSNRLRSVGIDLTRKFFAEIYDRWADG